MSNLLWNNCWNWFQKNVTSSKIALFSKSLIAYVIWMKNVHFGLVVTYVCSILYELTDLKENLEIKKLFPRPSFLITQNSERKLKSKHIQLLLLCPIVVSSLQSFNYLFIWDLSDQYFTVPFPRQNNTNRSVIRKS